MGMPSFFQKPVGGIGNLRKGFYKNEEAVGLYYPSTVINTSDEQYITQDTPVGRYVTDENGKKVILRAPFIKAVPQEIRSLQEQYRAEANAANQQVLQLRREIAHAKNQVPMLPPVHHEPVVHGNIYVPNRTKGIFYYNEETGVRENLSNFDIRMISIIQNYQQDELIKREVKFSVIMESQEIDVIVQYGEIDSIAKIVQREVIGAIVYAQVTKVEKKLAEVFRERLKNVPIEKCQCSAGWMTLGDRKIFAHDAHIPVEQNLIMQTGKSIIYKQNLLCYPYQIFIEILKLAPIQVIAPIIAVCLLGSLHHMFSMANVSFTPRFILFINGKTGSLKTAVSKILFTFFNADNPVIPASFKDTKTALEMRLKEYSSVPILVDDFYSTGIKKEQVAMKELLETVVRFVGDGIGKNRSNAQLKDVKGMPPSGMVVVTGEDTAGQMSTLLRCLILNVDKGTFDAKVLSEFQNNPFKWSSFLAAFISYLEENYLKVVSMIGDRFETLREKYALEFGDRRPVDQMVQMQIALEILCDFLLKWSLTNDVVDILNKCINGCFIAVQNSLEYVKENSGENQYLITMAKLIHEKNILIAEEKKVYIENIQKYDGFQDETHLYLRSDAVYMKVRKYFQAQGRELAISALNANRTLDKVGLLVTEIENRGTSKEKKLLEVKVKIGDKRPRMLKIYQELFWSLVQTTM